MGIVRHKYGNDFIKKEVFYILRALKTGSTACHAGPHGEAPGLVRHKESKGKMSLRAFIVVFTWRDG